jgi:hypothetical protein
MKVVGEQKANSATLVRYGTASGARQEKIWTEQELKEIARNLALLSVQGVREFYERAYRECRISGRDFPPARAVQELVQAWKQLRKWRARG